MIVAAYMKDEEHSEPGTTTVAALLLCYMLAAMVWYGFVQLAVIVIVIASVVVLLRLAVIATFFAHGIARTLPPVLATGFVVGCASLLFWRSRDKKEQDPPMPDIKNPTELRLFNVGQVSAHEASVAITVARGLKHQFQAWNGAGRRRTGSVHALRWRDGCGGSRPDRRGRLGVTVARKLRFIG
ncbi:MAG: DUF4010 domain-containing protein [Burkholderiales bacterium]